MRKVDWVGDSHKRIKEFPEDVQWSIGNTLRMVQGGETPTNVKPLKGVGSGVFEIVERHRGNAYRAVYAVQIGEKIYVLHVFQKKSKVDIKTPKPDIDLIKQRYNQAQDLAKDDSEE